MRKLACALILLAACVAAPGWGAAPPTFVVHGAVHALAMDGPRVALGIRPKSGCDEVVVWNVLTGTRTKVSGKKTCAVPRTSTGVGIREVAIAGARVAWISDIGGNTEHEDFLFTGSALRSTEARLATARSRNGWTIQGLVGHGDLLAYGTVRRAENGGGILASAVRRIGGQGLSPTTTRTLVRNARFPQATDGRLVAVLDGIYDTTAPGGAAIVPPQGVAVRGYALDAGRRIGLGPDMNASPTILAVDVRTGATVGSAALPFLLPSFARVDASGRLAIVLSYRTLLLADLETGRSIVFLHAPRRIADAALETTGLAYALAGHVHFVPYASLLARVAG